MPTRFYFPSTGTPAITPAFHAEWNATASAVRRPLSYPKGTSAFATVTVGETSGTNPYDVAQGQFISAPLAAQSFSGTLSCVARCSQSATFLNGFAQMVVKVVSGDGTVVRGVLIEPSALTSSPEFPSSLTNRYFPVAAASATLTELTCQDGDRLVVELGYRAANSTTSSYPGSIEFGESGAADLAQNQTGTTQGNPWISFSQDILFAETTPAVTGTSSSTLASLQSQAFGQFGEVEPFEATSEAILPMIYTESAISGPGPAITIEAAFTLPDYYFFGNAWRIAPRVIEARIVAPKYYFSSTARASDASILVSGRITAPKYYFSATGTAS